METSADLGLPYIDAQQAQPEVTHNEALNLVQALLNGVLSRGDDSPPASPANGDAYIVGTAPTGAWVGRSNSIAAYFDGWVFVPAEDDAGAAIAISARHEGVRVWVRDENQMYVWSGFEWRTLTSTSDDISCFVIAPEDGDITLKQYVRRSFSIEALVGKIADGGCTVAIKLNDVAVPDLTAVAVTSTETTTNVAAGSPATNIANVGDTLSFTISSSAGSPPSAGLALSLLITYLE